MGTWIVLLITIPLVGWLTAVVVATPRRERRRVAELAEGAHARGWTYTEDASRLRPPPPQLREWQRPVMFREGFSGTYRGQEFWVAHVTYESTDPARQGRRRHATLCWLRLPFPLNDVRIVPLELLEERQPLVGGTVHRTGDEAFDARFAILTDDELLGRMATGPAVRTLLTVNQIPWSVTLQGLTVVAERLDRVPQSMEDALNGVAIADAVARGLTGQSQR